LGEWRKNQQAQTKEIMPEVEIQIEQFRDRTAGTANAGLIGVMVRRNIASSAGERKL